MRIMKRSVARLSCAALLVLVVGLSAAFGQGQSAGPERGKSLVTGMGCGDCHTPMKMGPVRVEFSPGTMI